MCVLENFQKPTFHPTKCLLRTLGGHWSGKSQGNLIFLQGQGKVREFSKLVREILNTKKVKEKSGNFMILAKIYVVAGILTT